MGVIASKDWSQRERRTAPAEVRVERADGGPAVIKGHAAVFNSFSVPLGFEGFREIIRPGAFMKTLQNPDVRALWNHNDDWVLGSTSNGTLRLREDETGLAVEIIPPDAQFAKDFVELIEERYVDSMSFGFTAEVENWTADEDGPIRELLQLDLFDVSPTPYPAYLQTDVGIRSVFDPLGIDWQPVAGVLLRAHRGQTLNPIERELLRSTIAVFETLLGKGERQAPNTREDGEEPQERYPVRNLKLRILEREHENLLLEQETGGE